jgi:hypothetical protein
VKTRLAAIGMAALLALYLVFVGQYAVLLITSEPPVAKALGIALAVLPVVGAWALVAEFVFVVRGERLLKRIEAEGDLPDDDLPRLPSGRIDAAAALEQFPRFRDAVEADPESWRAWARLSMSYDASGDRGRARWAMRTAIGLARAQDRAA